MSDQILPTALVYGALHVSGLWYVGSTTGNLLTRKYRHLADAHSGSQSKFWQALRDTYESDWTWVELDHLSNVTRRDLERRECEFQRALQAVQKGFNQNYAWRSQSQRDDRGHLEPRDNAAADIFLDQVDGWLANSSGTIDRTDVTACCEWVLSQTDDLHRLFRIRRRRSDSLATGIRQGLDCLNQIFRSQRHPLLRLTSRKRQRTAGRLIETGDYQYDTGPPGGCCHLWHDHRRRRFDTPFADISNI